MSLTVIDPEGFVGSSIRNIAIDAANPHYFVSGDFLMAFSGMTQIRYFGNSGTVTIRQESESLGDYCFAELTVTTIMFEDSPKLSRIGNSAFASCSALKSIWIPTCVETLGDYCFAESAVTTITFEDPSQLTRIGNFAFSSCWSLRSSCIPACVESLGKSCFSKSKHLAQLTFEPGSRLAQIGEGAFERCQALVSICIPAQVEVIPRGCFCFCDSFAELRFAPGSRANQIDIAALGYVSSLRSINIPSQIENMPIDVRSAIKAEGAEFAAERIRVAQHSGFCRNCHGSDWKTHRSESSSAVWMRVSTE
jgi:hypothetical protein